MAKKRLTELVIERTKPPASGRVELWDDLLPGFGVRISNKGRRTFFLMYRSPIERTEEGEGVRKRLALGKFPVVDLAKARDLAREKLALIDRGVDPGLDQEDAPKAASLRVAAVVADFILKHHRGIDKAGDPLAVPKRRSWRETQRIFDRYVLPVWSDRDITAIKKQDVARLLAVVAQNNGPIMANRTLSAVRKLFNWALVQPHLMNVLDVSPIVPGMAPSQEREKDRFLSADEIRLFWAVAETIGYPFGTAALLMLLSGQRQGEVGRMKWSDLDLERRVWTLPRASTKADRRHEVMLSDLILEIIGQIPRGAGEWVFSTTGRTPISGWSKAKSILDRRIAALQGEEDRAFEQPWSYHDLRRTFATVLEDELDTDKHVIGAILNHAETGATGIYTKGALRRRKLAAMQAFARYILTVLGRLTAENVIDLRGSQ